MKKIQIKCTSLTVFILISFWQIAFGQALPEFYMSDTTVNICKGILYDSEVGSITDPGAYGNFEDFTFHICPGVPVTIFFNGSVFIEDNEDFLYVHDGPTTGSPLIATITGDPATVGSYTSSGGCITLHFVSDNSVVRPGWEMQWTAQVPPPVPPTLTPVIPSCSSPTMTIQFDKNVHCDSIRPGDFQVTGNLPVTVIDAQPVSCSGDSTMSAEITLDTLWNQNCDYIVDFTINLLDRCDSVWTFTETTTFTQSACPIEGIIESLPRDTVCPGQCVTLEAFANGCLPYTYSWSNGLTGKGPSSYCPAASELVEVTITDPGSGNSTVATLNLVVVEPEITHGDTTICRSADTMNLNATPPGGIWSGNGIIDEDGVFAPIYAGTGTHVITYEIGGCNTSVNFTIDSIDAGPDESACPGTPFLLNGWGPAGGTWSGTNVATDGTFDPVSVGSYTVTYTEGGCSDEKIITVGNLSFTEPYDTICQSHPDFELTADPPGGFWYGPNIEDSITGEFDPYNEYGDVVTTYQLSNCNLDWELHIKPLDIGFNRSACPTQDVLVLYEDFYPLGGVWSGIGIIDVDSGDYDPSIVGEGNYDTVTYIHSNGCGDTIRVFVKQTEILPNDTFLFCENDDEFEIEPDTNELPKGGEWSGAGFYEDDDDYFFEPDVAGSGVHLIYYTKNTCVDSATFIVYPSASAWSDTTLCQRGDSIQLVPLPPGGYYSGLGITDSVLGIFDPTVADTGLNYVQMFSPLEGCGDTISFRVEPFANGQFLNLDSLYCSLDTNIELEFSPEGGILSTPTGDSIFNPVTYGPGVYEFSYSFVGTGACSSSDTVYVTVLEPLVSDFSLETDSLCPGETSEASVDVSGGDSTAYSILWSHLNQTTESISIYPLESNWYSVTTSDGCSEDVIDSFYIYLAPEIRIRFLDTASACWQDSASLTLGIDSSTLTYLFGWDGGLPSSNSTINGLAGDKHDVLIKQVETGCKKDTTVRIPSYPIVTAGFLTNPTQECINYKDRELTLIDYSQNATQGLWTIDTITEIKYEPGAYPIHFFEDPGFYSLYLFVENQYGCWDTASLDICIKDTTTLYIPDIFSPNGDGVNDEFKIYARNIIGANLMIYNRWGEKVYWSENLEEGWNGKRGNEKLPSGVYVYMLNVTLADGTEEFHKGEINLLR